MVNLVYMSFGAGVQTGAIAEMVFAGDLPKPDIFVFSDTGNEPVYVYEYVTYTRRKCERAGIEFVQLSAGNMLQHIYGGKRFAALPVYSVNHETGRHEQLRRQCTREYKIEPIERLVREKLLTMGFAKRDKRGAIRVQHNIDVRCWQGISLDEVERMRDNKTRWITNVYPLINLRMTRHDCTRWLEKRGLPVPLKSSCIVCPFHGNRYWRMLRDQYPEHWQQAVAFDNDLRGGSLRLSATAKGTLYLHRQCIPLTDVDLSTPEENGQLALSELCDGYCGL